VAVSYDTLQAPSDDLDYGRAADFVRRLVGFLLGRPALPPGILLNVNVPYVPGGQALRSRLTRLGGEAYSNYLVTGRDPHGREYYWITGDPLTGNAAEGRGTDIEAVAEGYVSITPIHLDMTEHALLTELRPWESELDRDA
jgi:5'-nucleotidase